MSNPKETLGFQAEVKQLLHLMIHSLYSNREIFLRELVSNASDACDKLRFEAIHNGALYEDDSELKIGVSFDKDARTITITDNGIGLNREDAINHLGTIAKSGTREFFSKLTGDQQKDASPDRPVRRRFLLGLYRRRQGQRVFAQGRRERQPGHTLGMRYGRRGQRRVQHRGGREGQSRHRNHPASA